QRCSFAVVRQKYEVQVRDAYVLPGNTGVLRCEIPTFVKEYVAVTSWVRDSAYNIFPTPKSDDRHHMLPTGELLVFSVTSSDAQSSYRCRTVHRVTGDTVESSSYARLVVTGKFYTMIHTLDRVGPPDRLSIGRRTFRPFEYLTPTNAPGEFLWPRSR
ncbi:unnamed protein product, partial [Heterotrigona itama]